MVKTPAAWPAAAAVGLAKALKKETVTVRRDGVWITCGTKPGQGAWCAIAGLGYEPELPWILGRLGPGDTFVDVGANTGIYTVHAARKVGPTGKVFSVEPCEPATKILEKNVENNGLGPTVRIIRAAASEANGSFYLSGDPDRWNALQLSAAPSAAQLPILGMTLDSLLEGQERVRAIKIDVEGLEAEILKGAARTLARHKPALVFENTFRRTRNRAAQWLSERGYLVGFLPETIGNRPQEMVTSGWASHWANLVAIPCPPVPTIP